MTPSQRARNGCEAARNAKWRITAPPVPLLKRAARAPQAWPIHIHPKGQAHRPHLPPPPPHLPFFHTRHAEESAERPHLVTVVRPCSHSALRKVTVLLNRRGVVSFDQLLLDISEALGFPQWHRARVTRLYTTHAREVKGICDFFRGEVAFLALGKARPELSSVQEALEELFPEHSYYQAEALRAWEKRLCPVPDKAAKADSGYSEEGDSSETHTNQETHQDTNTCIRNHTNAHTVTQPPCRIDKHQPENYNSDAQKCKKNPGRKFAYLPNHLQRLRVRGGVREHQPFIIGQFKHDESLREADSLSPTLCEKCLARRAKHQIQQVNRLSGKVPLPPVLTKQKGSSCTEQELRKLYVQISPPPPRPIRREEEKRVAQLQPSDPLPDVGQLHSGTRQRVTFDLPSDISDVTLEDIERCYDIGRVVGDGNFAIVRECRHRDNGQTLAVKIVERSKLIGREHMMQNELSLLGSLCHPRIVRLFAHHHTQTHSYLVMELVSGGDLFEAISEKGKFSEAEAGLMVSDVSEALNYIHCKSIVHRDLKPENLLIECAAAGTCRLKLGDFGLAMVVTEPVFTICGTPTYVAPEILCETGYGVAVDVWALGVILYILLCGFPPFRSRDRDQDELFHLIKQGQLHFLSPYWDPISEEARGVVRALIQPDPTVRLTAKQTLRHPWVKAMASVCRQRALTDRAQKNTADNGAEPDGEQRPAQTNAAEIMTDETPGHTSSKRETTYKGQQRPESIPTGSSSREASRREMQEPGPKLSNKDYDPGSLTSLSAEHNQLSRPSAQTDPPVQLKIQSKQQSPPYSPSSTDQARQTTVGHAVHPSSNPAATSSSPSPLVQRQLSPVKHHHSHHPKPPSPKP